VDKDACLECQNVPDVSKVFHVLVPTQCVGLERLAPLSKTCDCPWMRLRKRTPGWGQIKEKTQRGMMAPSCGSVTPVAAVAHLSPEATLSASGYASQLQPGASLI
jgi:hypothetical protein